MRPLFRPEAVEAQRQQWLGRVQLVRPLGLSVITAGIVVVAVALVAFLSFAEYTRKATVAGVLVPDRGLIRVVPAASGTVLERRVTEGQAVRAGDVLFVIALERSTLEGPVQTQVQRSLSERQRSLHDSARQQQLLVASQQAALDRRLQALQNEAAQIDAEAALQRQRLALANEAFARLESLRNDQFISSAQLQAKSEELLGLRAQAQALERQRAALAREQAELEGERRGLPLLARGALGAIERDLAALSREAAEQDAERQIVVRAPQDGTVTALAADPGQSVSPQAALASLVPAGARLQAHLYAPSSAVGFVRAAQTVRLRYEAFPYQRFGHHPGQVLQVSRTPLAPSELQALSLPVAPAEGQALFRITVALDAAAVPPAEALPLVPGMRLQADVLLERRRLIAWLFEPLLGLQGRL
ncbi:HlyD family secretion protein [Rubrivivax sp. RP6-9]|uniref:HlyD family secretion protein n=1 Tax=Rubrivivax sp. RP6-9 TaxID=3415750 RepID=UPI003CC57A69